MFELLCFCETLHVETSIDKWLVVSDEFRPTNSCIFMVWLQMWSQEHVISILIVT